MAAHITRAIYDQQTQLNAAENIDIIGNKNIW